MGLAACGTIAKNGITFHRHDAALIPAVCEIAKIVTSEWGQVKWGLKGQASLWVILVVTQPIGSFADMTVRGLQVHRPMTYCVTPKP